MRYLFVILSLFLLGSCKEEIIGKCSTPFQFKIEKPYQQESAKVYSVDVKGHKEWWLAEASVDGKLIDKNSQIKYENATFIWDNEYFIIERVNANSIRVTPKQDFVNSKIAIGLEAGNCFGSFVIE